MNSYKLMRLWKGLTVKQFAESVGLSVGTIAAVENGQREPSPEVRAAYARTFPITDDFFMFVESFSHINPTIT
ncbi:helix-turn-helix domain-containing protein [Sporosarcina sp. ITBMC105]